MELTSSSGALTWAHVFGQICWRFKSRTEALSDPEIKSLTKEWEENTHRGSQCEWVVRGERRRDRNVAYGRRRERAGGRVSLALDRPCPLRPPDTESTVGVCWWWCQCEIHTCGQIWEQKITTDLGGCMCVCVCICFLKSPDLWMNVTSVWVCVVLKT